jgi:transposase-like protein
MKVVSIKQTKSTGAKTSVMSPAALPPVTTKRWVASRKAAVVAAVQSGVLTMAEACRRYSLSNEEFVEWVRHYEAKGLSGLRAGVRLHHPDYPVH